MYSLTTFENGAPKAPRSFCQALLFLGAGLIPLLSIFTSCELGSTKVEMPQEFGFQWDNGWDEHYDSEPSVFRRHTIHGDTYAYFTLDSADAEMIWTTMTMDRFLELPKKIECKPGGDWIEPSTTTRITVWLNGDTLRFQDEGGCLEPLDQDASARFRHVDHVIDSMLKSQPAVRTLPESGMIML